MQDSDALPLGGEEVMGRRHGQYEGSVFMAVIELILGLALHASVSILFA